MKVLLISANTLRAPYPVYPLGLDYVAGAIAPAHQVSRLDLNTFEDSDGLRQAVRALQPQIIALSLRNIDNSDALNPRGFMAHYLRLTRTLRSCCPAPIVLGGTGFTLYPLEAMQLLGADYGVIGEGERLGMLIDALEKGKDPAGLPGIVVRRSPVLRQPVPWPSPVKRSFDLSGPPLDFYLRNGGMLNVQTKRGCPFRCIYCSYPYIEGRSLRYEPPEQIARTAVALQEAGARYIFITDSAFNADVAQSLTVAKAMKKAGLTIPWGGFFAPLPMPAHYFPVLAECGLKHVEFGSESLCDAVLARYGKPFSRSDIFKAHEAANSAGLHVAHYFLFGGPGETPATLATSLANIEKLEKAVFFLFCGMRIYPHTPLYRLALEQGQIRPEQSILAPVFFQPPSMSLSRIAGTIEEQARGRYHWVRAAGDGRMSELLARLYKHGHTGPLWEYLLPFWDD